MSKVIRLFVLLLATVFALSFIGCTEEAAEPIEGATEEGTTEEGVTEEGATEEGGEEGAAVEGGEEDGTEEGGEEEIAADEGPTVFETPEAVFAAAKEATEAADFTKLVKCFDPSSKRDMAAGMVTAVGQVTKKDKEKKAAADELFAKYSIPDVKKLKGPKKKKMKAVGEAITDVDGFLVDTMKFIEENGSAKKPPSPYAGEIVGKAKVKGDKAVMKVKGVKGKPKPMKFVKVEQSWYIGL